MYSLYFQVISIVCRSIRSNNGSNPTITAGLRLLALIAFYGSGRINSSVDRLGSGSVRVSGLWPPLFRVPHFTSMWKRIFRVIICRFTALHSWVGRRGKENVSGMPREVLVFRFFRLRTGSALMEHCMLTRAGVRYRSGREVKIGNPGFIFSDGRSAGSGHVDFRIKEGQTVCRWRASTP